MSDGDHNDDGDDDDVLMIMLIDDNDNDGLCPSLSTIIIIARF